MGENICTILLNRTLNRETDDAPIGTVEGNEYYLNVKNGLKKWEQYIDIAPTRNSDEPNHLYIDSYLYQKIRDDLEFLLVYTDLFLLRNGNNENYYPLHCHNTDEHSTGAWIDTQRFLVLEQLDEANINENGIDIPVESKWGIQKDDGDKLVVTCTVNGNYLIRYITGNDLYILTYIIQYSLNRYVTSYTFVPFSRFKNIVESKFDEYGLYIYENAYYGLFWSLRNNSLRPSLNNIISLILKEGGSESEYTFNIYLAEKDTLHWKYNEYLSLFKEGMYDLTEEQNNKKPLILLYPLYFNKDVSLTYIAPDESVTDTKYFIHGNDKSFSHDSYELYKHNYYIPYDSLDVKTLMKELPAGRFRIIESYPCDFNRFNIKISPMWDSELDADPVAIELVCVLKNKDASIADLQSTYIYHKKDGELICEKIDKDGIFDVTGKNKQNLLRSEQSFFLNDDAFKISDLSSVEVTVTPVMIFGPLYDLSKIITIETDKINTNTIELSIYKYYYDKDKIVLTYNIEQYLDANATIYNDSRDPEYCPHCYVTKLSDFIANEYRTDKEKGVEIKEISKSLLSSVYNTVNIPLDDYIIPTEIYVIEFCIYIYHLGSFIRRSLFRIINTTEMFNNAFLDGKMIYSDGLIVENVNDFQQLYLDPGGKYLSVQIQEGSYQLLYPDALKNKTIKIIATGAKPEIGNVETNLKLHLPSFTDSDTLANIVIECGNSEGSSFPYSFNMSQPDFTNIESYFYGYYDNNEYKPYDTIYPLKFNYTYREVTDPNNDNEFKAVTFKYLDISLMQYGAYNTTAFGLIWRAIPKFNTCGAFNLSTYGWDSDSSTYLSYMYLQGELDGYTVLAQWVKLLYSQWTGDYMSLFKLSKCPAANNSFVPVYICGMQHGTADSLDGDGRMNYLALVLPPRNFGTFNYYVITGYGNRNHRDAGIPTGGTGELWYQYLYRDYQGQIIWNNGGNSLLTGIWFARERTESEQLYLKTENALLWQNINSKSLANVIAAKLSLYYFRMPYLLNMEDFYSQSDIPKDVYGKIYMLLEADDSNNTNLSTNTTINVKLRLFAKFGYTKNKEFKLLASRVDNAVKLYRFINLNDYILYKVGDLYKLLNDIKLDLYNGLLGDEDHIDNVLNNLFFNNLSQNTIANELVDDNHKIEGDTGDHFINMITNGKLLINKDDLDTHSIFVEYDQLLNSLPAVKLATKNSEDNKNVLCIYPDGKFSVTLNSIEDTSSNGYVLLFYCPYGKHDLYNINGVSGYLGITDLAEIKNVGRYAFVDTGNSESSCLVIPCLTHFNPSDKTFNFAHTSNSFIWNKSFKNYYIRSIYDLKNGTKETSMTTVIQNIAHPI